MGNCLRHQSSTTLFSDDDWEDDASDSGSFAASSTKNNNNNNNNGKTAATTTATEVKIKITKKQLAELFGKVDVKELRLEQVLAQLLAHSHACDDHSLHRPWRPALQSIPEVN